MTDSTPQVGVIVARFQVPQLHKGHHDLIRAVQARHRKVLILLGCARTRVTRHNPLDFFARERMLKQAYPDIPVLAVSDHRSDHVWSAEVDGRIAEATGDEPALLYGSRDSFIPHYHGRHPTQEVGAAYALSGTQLRKDASEAVRSEKGFRMGVIYAAFQRFPTAYPTVDVLPWRRQAEGGEGRRTGPLEVLLGRKFSDGATWRFVGGFVTPQDESLELAAMREATEETGLALHPPTYLFSARVEDWRYRDETDGICTAVFAAAYFHGAAKAGDDLNGVDWFPCDRLSPDLLVPEHAPLWERAKAGVQRVAEA